MSRERVELAPINHEPPRRSRLVCSSKEDGHRHNRGCYQRIRRGRRSRRHLRVSSPESNYRNYDGNLLRFSGEVMSKIKEGFRDREHPTLGFVDKEVNLLGEEMKRRGGRRFKRVVPFKPRVLPEPIRLPSEGDIPEEPKLLPLKRRAA